MRYLNKYKGTYRVMAHYNQDTNDFPRDHLGNIDQSFDDYYIPCKIYKGSQIYHYGGSSLVFYIPSLQVGRKVKLAIDEIDQSIVYDYVETSEVEFKFKAKHMDIIAGIVIPKTSGADISSLSVKNLPKQKYVIPEIDMVDYKDLINKFELKDILTIFSEFDKVIIKFMKKKTGNKQFDIMADRRLNMIKGKDYIHFVGMWDEFLKFLKSKVK